MNKRILITSRSFGKISDEPMNILKDAGFEVVMKGADFDQEEFERIIPEFDALIIGAHPFPAEVLERCPRLQIICKHGVGLDNIPLEKAKEMGVAVCNTPGTNSNAVADLAFGMMLALARGIVASNNAVRGGEWKTYIGVDVCNKTLGLLGFGAIAKCVARRAHGFGMKVMVYNHRMNEIPEEFKDYLTLTTDITEVLRAADFLSVHLPLNDETVDTVTAKEMAMMKKGSFIINTARGGIVNEKDLYEAVKSGHIAGTAMDVSVVEPMAADNPLRTLDNAIITPHIGMYSKEAIGAVSLLCAQNAAARIKGEALVHQVV